MNFFNGVVSNIANINTATFNGAIDVVFVEQKSGVFKSTPFHVRVGKIGVVWAERKAVNIEINGKEVDLTMRLDERGKAYFDPEKGFDEPDEAVKEEKSSSLLRPRARHQSDPEEESLSERGAAACTSLGSQPQFNEIVEDLVQAGRVLTLDLTEADLAKYNLRRGCNEMAFSVTTQFQGTSRCQCNAFVWNQEDKIVISDIDGTITKSDVRGMVLPLIGAGDWAQGEVTSLFSKISCNGYKVVYLSARSISQATETKAYLQSLSQGNLRLPPGPLLLNPESALRSFKREVIDKRPEIFKIKCLDTLKDLYYRNPYFAGYGNKPTDVAAYQAVGISLSHIFIINKSGSVQHQVSESVVTSYRQQADMLDMIFPPIQESQQQDFSYWSLPLPHVNPSQFKM